LPKGKNMSKKAKRTQRIEIPQQNIATPVVGNSVRRSSEFNPDYSDTIKDLKRIGTLAGSFVMILVVLSFFLR
jgi:hypothetical protein